MYVVLPSGIVSHLVIAGSSLQALQLLDVMEEAGVRPDAATWRTLLSQSRYLGRLDVADLVSYEPSTSGLP